MRAYEILFEGRDAPLYHSMQWDKAAIVFSKDEMAANHVHKLAGKKIKGTSLSRNPRLGNQADPNYGPVWIEFDQRKLTQRYKIMPLDADLVNYYGRMQNFPQSLGPKQRQQTDKNLRKDFGHQHAEEFVLGDIKPLHKFIKSITIIDAMDKQCSYVTKPGTQGEKGYAAVKKYVEKFNIKFVDMCADTPGHEWRRGMLRKTK